MPNAQDAAEPPPLQPISSKCECLHFSLFPLHHDSASGRLPLSLTLSLLNMPFLRGQKSTNHSECTCLSLSIVIIRVVGSKSRNSTIFQVIAKIAQQALRRFSFGPLRYRLLVLQAKGDRLTIPLAVLIAEPESISPEPSPRTVPADRTQYSRGSSAAKQHRTSTSRRLSGRAAADTSSLSLPSISSIGSLGSHNVLDPAGYEQDGTSKSSPNDARHQDAASHILSQVAEWLHQEKAKRATHKARRHSLAKLAHAAEATKNLVHQFRSDESRHSKENYTRTSSEVSEESLALEKLEQILSNSIVLGRENREDNHTPTEDRKNSSTPRRSKRQGSTRRLLRKASTLASSDTEHQEPDIDVPSAEVVLDNSKTLGYGGGGASSEVDLLNPDKRAMKEKEAWLQFKMEIIRLSHTLRLRGWRRISIDRGGDIIVERLSGCLTNAVYVVSPPSDLPQKLSTARDSSSTLLSKKPPP